MSMDDFHGVARADSYPPESYEHGNLLADQKDMACPSLENSQFLCKQDDMSLLESGLYYQTKAGKSNMDPRLLILLGYFRELYVRKGELFRKTFPGIQDEFVEFFKKIGEVVSQVKSVRNQTRAVKTLQRSLSCGSPRRDDAPPLRLDRFKIRTVVVDVDDKGAGQAGGGQAGGGIMSGGSK